MRASGLAAVLLAIGSPVLALNVVITAKGDGTDKPAIVGTTNLPDAIELLVTLSRKEGSFMAQDKVKVSQGAFRAGPFSQRGASLPPGVYAVEVMMPLAGVQPPPTWPAIGNDGSKLEGPLVKKSNFGGKIAQYRTTLRVGDGRASAGSDHAARVQADQDKHAWFLQSCKDICNLTGGVAKKRNERFDFERCYYRCVADEPTKTK